MFQTADPDDDVGSSKLRRSKPPLGAAGSPTRNQKNKRHHTDDDDEAGWDDDWSRISPQVPTAVEQQPATNPTAKDLTPAVTGALKRQGLPRVAASTTLQRRGLPPRAAEAVQIAIAGMAQSLEYHVLRSERDASAATLSATLHDRSSVDAWPANANRRQPPHRSLTPSGRLTGSSAAVGRRLTSLTPSPQTILNQSIPAEGITMSNRPPLLEHLILEIRLKLDALAIRFPQFRETALFVPQALLAPPERLNIRSRADDERRPRSQRGNSNGEEGEGVVEDEEELLPAWWDASLSAKRPPIVLAPLECDAYRQVQASSGDVFAAERLEVFREAGRHLCREFRTYRGALAAIFHEYDRYIHFCNTFIWEERGAILQIQQRMHAERQELLLQLQAAQQAESAMIARVEAAEEVARLKTLEAEQTRNELEQTISKAQLIDKIIADADTDKSILARKLIQVEREARSLQERLKAPEKKIAALQAQLEHKESFLKDLSRRYERACNALDSVKKQLREEQEAENRAFEAERQKRSVSAVASGGKTAAISNAAILRETRDRLAATQAKCALLEAQLQTLHSASSAPLSMSPSSPTEVAPTGSGLSARGGRDTLPLPTLVPPSTELPASYDTAIPPMSARSRANNTTTMVSSSTPRVATSLTPTARSPRIMAANESLTGTMGSSSSTAPTMLPTGGRSVESPISTTTGGGGAAASFADCPSVTAQLHVMAPEDRVPFCVKTIATLLTDLADARTRLREAEVLLNPAAAIKKGRRGGGGAAGGGDDAVAVALHECNMPLTLLHPLENPFRRFFLGSVPTHPNILLRTSGRVRNQKFSLLALKSHIHSFFAETATTRVAALRTASAAGGGGNEGAGGAAPTVSSSSSSTQISLEFLTWMRRKYGEDSGMMTFSFYTALSWFPSDMDSFLFRQLLDDTLSDAFWRVPYSVAMRCRECFEKASYRHGGAILPRAEATQILSVEFAAWELVRVDDLCSVLTTEVIEWRRLFGSLTVNGCGAGSGNGIEPLFVIKIRKHWLAEALTFRNELIDQILEDPQLGSGTVSPFTFVRSLLTVDPSVPEAAVLEVTGALFGRAVVDEVQQDPHHAQVDLVDRFAISAVQIPAEVFIAQLQSVPLYRSSRRAKTSNALASQPQGTTK